MPPQNSSSDPYEFITNPSTQPKRTINFGNSPLQRAIILGVGLLLLLIVFFVLLSVFNRAGNAQKDRLLDLAQTQAEIIRISGLADGQPVGITTRTLAINTKLAVQTDLNSTTDILAKRGVEVDVKDLDQKRNEQTDNTLEEAKATGRFEETFAELLRDQLEDCQRLLKDAQSGGQLEKQTFSQDYQELSLLL